MESSAEEPAVAILREKELVVITLTPHIEGLVSRASAFKLRKVKAKDLVVFSRQLSVMISATVPIVQALDILKSQTSNKTLSEVIDAMGEDVDGGMKFSEALAQHPEAFNEFYVSMVKAGEASGKLDDTLDYLAVQQERDYELAGKIKGAMMYPGFVVTAMVAVGIVMMIFVVPQMTQMLVDSGVELPLTTKILIGASQLLKNYWWLLLVLLIGLVAGLRAWIATPSGRLALDSAKIKLPVFGNLFRTIYLVRFTRSLSTLMGGGVPVAQALEIVAHVVGNAVWKRMLLETTARVREGNTISSQFLLSQVFPASVGHMISIGEQTSRLEEILNTLTSFYSKEIDTLVETMVSLIEPMIMVVMGVAVGGMVASILMPMFSLINAGGV